MSLCIRLRLEPTLRVFYCLCVFHKRLKHNNRSIPIHVKVQHGRARVPVGLLTFLFLGAPVNSLTDG
ncbi:Uncharacterized protein APZ42_023332 [Daphnia magna]|uniref:Uncharacterized protein n=1 Tax=Daphnia magna TaxID=35525 RepID=A0A164V1L0_9CRUS|nr:Uncharacterized protein APZ42_023332 [Daphnia magna]